MDMKSKITFLVVLFGLTGLHFSFKNALEEKGAFDPSKQKYQECIDACNNCASMCANCASECLSAKETNLNRCIQFCLETASICRSASELMSLNSDKVKEICKTCADLCNKCREECMKHNYDHCKECADACKKAEDLCMNMSK